MLSPANNRAMIRQSTIRQVEFNGKELNADELELLFRSLPNIRTLLNLCINDVWITSERSKLISEAMKTNITLEKLKCWDVQLALSETQILFSGLKENFSIRSLTLQNAELGSEGLKVLSQSLRDQHHSLTHLNISGNGIGPDGVSFLMVLLKKAPTLLALEVDNNNFGNDLAVSVSKFLASHPSLSALSVSENNINKTGAEALGTAISSANSGVKSLSIAANPLGDEGIDKITTGAAKSASLKSLNLAKTGMTEAGAKIAAKNLVSSGITMLSMDGNPLGDSGVKAWGKAIRRNKIFLKLSFADCGLGDGDVDVLTHGLAKNNHLTDLILDGNLITVTGTEALLPTLKQNKKLNVLSLLRTLVYALPDSFVNEHIHASIRIAPPPAAQHDPASLSPGPPDATKHGWRQSWRNSWRKSGGKSNSSEQSTTAINNNASTLLVSRVLWNEEK